MKQTLLHRFAVFFIAFGTFFSAASFAHANTFTLLQQYHYPGLTFSTPLTYIHPLPLPEPTAGISFSSQNKLMIAKNDIRKPLESIILTPTLAQTETTPSITDPTPTPTIYLQPTNTQLTALSQTPTITPAPTQQSSTVPTPSYSPAPVSNVGGLNADTLFSMVNSYRQSKGLSAFQQDAKTCSLATERAPEIAGEIAAGTMHSGLQALNLPYWNTENIISMNSEAAAFNWWINDAIHREAIESSSTYSCVACSGNSCAEEFTSYQPK